MKKETAPDKNKFRTSGTRCGFVCSGLKHCFPSLLHSQGFLRDHIPGVWGSGNARFTLPCMSPCPHPHRGGLTGSETEPKPIPRKWRHDHKEDPLTQAWSQVEGAGLEKNSIQAEILAKCTDRNFAPHLTGNIWSKRLSPELLRSNRSFSCAKLGLDSEVGVPDGVVEVGSRAAESQQVTDTKSNAVCSGLYNAILV